MVASEAVQVVGLRAKPKAPVDQGSLSQVDQLVTAYADELLDKRYETFLDALPKAARGPVLDGLSALQLRLAEHIAAALRSEETAEAVSRFIDRRVDEILARRLSDVLDAETYRQLLGFVESRFRNVVTERGFEQRLRDFVSARVDELARSGATLAELFTPETISTISSARRLSDRELTVPDRVTSPFWTFTSISDASSEWS